MRVLIVADSRAPVTVKPTAWNIDARIVRKGKICNDAKTPPIPISTRDSDKPIWDDGNNYTYDYYKYNEQRKHIKDTNANAIFIPTSQKSFGYCEIVMFPEGVTVFGENWEGWTDEFVLEEQLRRSPMEWDIKTKLYHWSSQWHTSKKLTGIRIYTLGEPQTPIIRY